MRHELAQFLNQYVFVQARLEDIKPVDNAVHLFLLTNVKVSRPNTDQTATLDHIHIRIDSRINPELIYLLSVQSLETTEQSVGFLCEIAQYKRQNGTFDFGLVPISDKLQDEYASLACADIEKCQETQELIMRIATNVQREFHITRQEYEQIEWYAKHISSVRRLSSLGLFAIDDDYSKLVRNVDKCLPLVLKRLEKHFENRAKVKKKEIVRQSKGFGKVA